MLCVSRYSSLSPHKELLDRQGSINSDGFRCCLLGEPVVEFDFETDAVLETANS